MTLTSGGGGRPNLSLLLSLVGRLVVAIVIVIAIATITSTTTTLPPPRSWESLCLPLDLPWPNLILEPAPVPRAAQPCSEVTRLKVVPVSVPERNTVVLAVSLQVVVAGLPAQASLDPATGIITSTITVMVTIEDSLPR